MTAFVDVGDYRLAVEPKVVARRRSCSSLASETKDGWGAHAAASCALGACGHLRPAGIGQSEPRQVNDHTVALQRAGV